MSKYFGPNLKYLREKKGLEQKELIEKIGYKASSVISEWEAGKRMPNIGIIHDLSRFFSVSIDDFVNKDITRGEATYYINPESARIAQEAFENPNLRILFDAARNIDPEDLKYVIDLAKRLEREENPDPADFPDEVYQDDPNQDPGEY